MLRAVDQGLLVPGEIVRAAIYERIERSYQLRRDEIPGKLETFHNALQDLPGKGSTFTVALPIKPSPEMKKK